MRRLLTAVVSFALFVVPSISAQNHGPLPPLTAHVDVNVVNVDVTVTDRSGRPVMNLTRGDFEIFEDGKLMPVTNFAIYETTSIQPKPPLTAAPASQDAVITEPVHRRIVLIVDNNFIENIQRNAALTALEKQLDTTYGGDAEWSVAAIGHTLSVVQPFTTQKPLIRAAIEKVKRMPTFLAHHEMDRSILSDRQRKIFDMDTDSYDYGEVVRFTSREQTFRAVQSLQSTARAVAEVARAHTADPGKKFMILLTGGMENNTSFTVYDKASDQELRALRHDKEEVIDGIVHEANAANFTIHVINARARGMQAPQHDVENKSSGIDMSSPNFFQRGGGNDPIDVADVDSIPLQIALGTGGTYLPSNDVRHSFEVVEADTSNFYSLGYSPAHNGDRKYHRINVKVKRSGVVVANRIGYFDLTADDRLEQSLHERMTFDQAVGPLPVKLTLGSSKSTDKNAIVVPVVAVLPMQRITLLPRDAALVGRVHVYLSVFDDNGRNVGFHHQLQEVTVSSEQAKEASQNFRYTMNVRLKKGAFTVVITLRDELSNELGSAVQEVRL
jgi:VWFA-related protein